MLREIFQLKRTRHVLTGQMPTVTTISWSLTTIVLSIIQIYKKNDGLDIINTDTLGSWTTIVWNIIQIPHSGKEYGPYTDVGYEYTVTLTLKIWLWVKVIRHPWVMDKNCEKKLSRSNLEVRSYGLGTDSGYVCALTLTLEIWPWVKNVTHPWVKDNNHL